MIWTDQWECRCGWQNSDLRKRCRNCGVFKSEGFVQDTTPYGLPR